MRRPFEQLEGPEHGIIKSAGIGNVRSIARTAFQDADNLQGTDGFSDRRTTDPHLLSQRSFRRDFGTGFVFTVLDLFENLFGDYCAFSLELLPSG